MNQNNKQSTTMWIFNLALTIPACRTLYHVLSEADSEELDLNVNEMMGIKEIVDEIKTTLTMNGVPLERPIEIKGIEEDE